MIVALSEEHPATQPADQEEARIWADLAFMQIEQLLRLAAKHAAEDLPSRPWWAAETEVGR